MKFKQFGINFFHLLIFLLFLYFPLSSYGIVIDNLLGKINLFGLNFSDLIFEVILPIFLIPLYIFFFIFQKIVNYKKYSTYSKRYLFAGIISNLLIFYYLLMYMIVGMRYHGKYQFIDKLGLIFSNLDYFLWLVLLLFIFILTIINIYLDFNQKIKKKLIYKIFPKLLLLLNIFILYCIVFV